MSVTEGKEGSWIVRDKEFQGLTPGWFNDIDVVKHPSHIKAAV